MGGKKSKNLVRSLVYKIKHKKFNVQFFKNWEIKLRMFGSHSRSCLMGKFLFWNLKGNENKN